MSLKYVKFKFKGTTIPKLLQVRAHLTACTIWIFMYMHTHVTIFSYLKFIYNFIHVNIYFIKHENRETDGIIHKIECSFQSILLNPKNYKLKMKNELFL